MWGVLWVKQGQSLGRPALPDSALASLSAGLESEVGTVLGGRRGRELPQVIEQRGANWSRRHGVNHAANTKTRSTT